MGGCKEKSIVMDIFGRGKSLFAYNKSITGTGTTPTEIYSFYLEFPPSNIGRIERWQ